MNSGKSRTVISDAVERLRSEGCYTFEGGSLLSGSSEGGRLEFIPKLGSATVRPGDVRTQSLEAYPRLTPASTQQTTGSEHRVGCVEGRLRGNEHYRTKDKTEEHSNKPRIELISIRCFTFKRAPIHVVSPVGSQRTGGEGSWTGTTVVLNAKANPKEIQGDSRPTLKSAVPVIRRPLWSSAVGSSKVGNVVPVQQQLPASRSERISAVELETPCHLVGSHDISIGCRGLQQGDEARVMITAGSCFAADPSLDRNPWLGSEITLLNSELVNDGVLRVNNLSTTRSLSVGGKKPCRPDLMRERRRSQRWSPGRGQGKDREHRAHNPISEKSVAKAPCSHAALRRYPKLRHEACTRPTNQILWIKPETGVPTRHSVRLATQRSTMDSLWFGKS